MRRLVTSVVVLVGQPARVWVVGRCECLPWPDFPTWREAIDHALTCGIRPRD